MVLAVNFRRSEDAHKMNSIEKNLYSLAQRQNKDRKLEEEGFKECVGIQRSLQPRATRRAQGLLRPQLIRAYSVFPFEEILVATVKNYFRFSSFRKFILRKVNTKFYQKLWHVCLPTRWLSFLDSIKTTSKGWWSSAQWHCVTLNHTCTPLYF